jgi:aminopeptidase N
MTNLIQMFFTLSFSVNPDHRAVVYCEGLRNGTASDFNLLWNRFLNFNVGHEQITILNALGCTKDPVLLRQLLAATLTDSIRYQDKATALSSVLSGNPENVDVVYDYLTLNFNAWAEK